jgi:curli biogenesis system outer membrane secretion channel CsgG
MAMNKRFALFLTIVFLVVACVGAPVKHDPMSFVTDPPDKERVPRVCKNVYESVIPRVAVVNFTNNTTFDYANMVQGSVQGTDQRTAVGGAAVGVAPGAAGIVWGAKEKRQFQRESQRIERQINAKLSESVEDGVMNELVTMGGSKVYTRNEMKKILEEQQFQRSGLVDDSQLVRLGKLAGIRFMVTGSVNNINLVWKDFGSSQLGQYGLGAAIAGGLIGTQEGWNITTDIALRILDVETGEILFSKIVSGKEIIGKTPYPNYDALIGGIKKAAAKGLEDVRPEMSKWFTLKGYIFQTRTSPDGSERSALVNIGSKMGLKAGQKLSVYTFQEITDPFDESKKSCDIQKIPVEIEVTDQLQDDKAWVIVKGDKNALKRVKVGQLVERVSLEGQSFMKKMGY